MPNFMDRDKYKDLKYDLATACDYDEDLYFEPVYKNEYTIKLHIKSIERETPKED